jgi:PAS domain-containing protein
MHVATDALLTVDAQTLCLLEGNPAAMQLLQAGDLPLAGRVAEQQFEARARPAVRELLLQAGRRGQAVEIQARLAGTHLSARLLAMPLRTNGGQRLLLRVRMPEPTASLSQPPETKRAGLGEGTGDGVVVTDLSGRVLGANRGFVHLVATADEDEVRGRPLADWLGPNEHDLAALLRAVRDSGLVQNRALSLCLAGQLPQGLAVTGMLLIEGDQECLGFIVRRQCHLHMAPAIPQAAPLPLGPAIEALASELGSTPLAQLLQRAEELARQHLVQRALEQSPSDAAAARLLGISGAQLAKLKNELALALAAAAGR